VSLHLENVAFEENSTVEEIGDSGAVEDGVLQRLLLMMSLICLICLTPLVKYRQTTLA